MLSRKFSRAASYLAKLQLNFNLTLSFVFFSSSNRPMSIMLLNLMVRNWRSRFIKLQFLYSSMANYLLICLNPLIVPCALLKYLLLNEVNLYVYEKKSV